MSKRPWRRAAALPIVRAFIVGKGFFFHQGLMRLEVCLYKCCRSERLDLDFDDDRY